MDHHLTLNNLPADGERLDEDVVERGAVVELLAELAGLGAELVILELRDLVLELVDLIDQRSELLELALVGGPEELLHCPGKHGLAELAHPEGGRKRHA